MRVHCQPLPPYFFFTLPLLSPDPFLHRSISPPTATPIPFSTATDAYSNDPFLHGPARSLPSSARARRLLPSHGGRGAPPPPPQQRRAPPRLVQLLLRHPAEPRPPPPTSATGGEGVGGGGVHGKLPRKSPSVSLPSFQSSPSWIWRRRGAAVAPTVHCRRCAPAGPRGRRWR